MRLSSSLMLSAVVAASLLAGCRSDKVPLTPVQQGAAVGGVLGGTTGAIWANQYTGAGMGSLTGGLYGAAAGAATGALVGDALDEYGQKSDMDALKAELNAKGGELQAKDNELDRLNKELADARAKTAQEPNVKVEAKDGQLRFTILNEVLFDSGKAELKGEGLQAIDSVLAIIGKDYADREISIEGHTDNEPIKVSGWKSNWDLSYARSMAVLTYAQKKGIAPDHLRASACGEYHPVAPNDSAANKRLNRRAVIVVMPPKDSIILDKM